ncbi:MAG TPA: M13 family metallopeptidase [Rhizomicrobium sp.]|nr:M13 family metallopeptidase [Rhizomicrobium sp.]
MSVLKAGTALALCLFASAACADGGKTAIGTWGVDLSALDKSVKPGDDFFRYVNGNWLKTAVIPPDRSSTGSFQDLRILSENRMKEIVNELEARPYNQLTAEEKKLRDLYDAFMDQKQIESRGLEPARKDLRYLAGLKTLEDVAAAMGKPSLPTASPFGIGIGYEDKHPDSYALNLAQSGLGLPDRDYYLGNDKDIAATREAYRKYLGTMLGLAKIPDAQARADKVFALETQIAKVHWPVAEKRDRDKVYNPMPISELKKLAPEFPWSAFFAAGGIAEKGPKGEREIIVREKTAMGPIAKIFAATPVAVWRDYLTVHYLHAMAPYLPKAFDDADFAFYGKVLNGNQQQLPRETRGVHLLDDLIGEALGKLYVAKYFPPEAKAKAEALVANLRKAYDADIRTLAWMTPETKEKALDKLHKFTPHIGYPDKWRDYSAYAVNRDDLIGDVERGQLFEWNRELGRIDEPVDKTEWGMTPPTVNAYYQPSLNEVVFPAAILQPPFFDPNADDAVNYGGIGAVIGHELSHGYDDQGSKVDGNGSFNNWWTEADRKNFEERVSKLGKQYDQYEPLPGLHVNGKLTMGENIGDLSGLTIALKAYHISLEGKPAPVLDGFTGDQRFFLSYGQIWRSLYRDGAMRAQVLSNPHSPPEFRVNGITRNIDDWYESFDVKPGQKYYLAPEDRVKLW